MKRMSEGEEAELRMLEGRLQAPDATESRASLAVLLAEAFQEVSGSGRMLDSAALLDSLVPGGRAHPKLQDFKGFWVRPGVALVTHVARHLGGPGWQPPAFCSSVWTWETGRWQVVFRQYTHLREED